MPPTIPSVSQERADPRPNLRLWLFLGYALLGLGTTFLSRESRSLGLNFLNTVVFTHAGLATLSRSSRETSAAWGWRLFGLGLMAQAFNQAWATWHIVRHAAPPPFPAWGDIFSILSLGLLISALLAWPLASTSGSERLRKGLDGLGAALSAFFMSWFFALGPLFHRSDSTQAERTVMVVFFMGNATILGICAYLGARQTSRFRGPLGWITAGFGISILQVMLQVPLTLAGDYRLGDPLDLLVLLAALLILMAPLAPRALEPGAQPDAEIRDASRTALFLPMLPAALGLAFVLAGLAWDPVRLDPPLLGMMVALTCLGLARGMLALRDLQQLSFALESRVLERTGALESMQQAMLRTERMNAMAVLGAGLAHDLNNALTAVRTRAELARMKLDRGQAPEARDLDHILVVADQSTALTRRLMSFGRMEEPSPVALCLREELSSLETILRMLLGQRTALRLVLGDRAMPVYGSRAQIEQIFVNLVANARDAMPEGGTITIRLTREIVGGAPVAQVEVEDTGEGMSPETLARIFDPFFTTKGPGRGTGLGLASVRQLLLDLGGTVMVASEPGRGTTFRLHIPLSES